MRAERTCRKFTDALVLDSGAVLPGFTVAYEMYGEMSPERDNVILICPSLTKDCHAAGFDAEGKRGWWDQAIGAGRMLATDRYCMLCISSLGGACGCSGPASLNPETGAPYALDFPVFTVRDMVRVQKRLVDELNIAQLFAVVGGCLGGQQALEWAITHPAAIRNAVVISATAAASAHSVAIFAVMSRLIRDDPAWNYGNYYEGEFPIRGLQNALVAAVPLWMSSDVMEQRFGRKLHARADYGFSLENEFEVEFFLEGVAERAEHCFDPNGLLYLMRATQYFDLAHTYTSLRAALARITARVLLISYESDWRYPPSRAEELQVGLQECGKDSRHARLASTFGHGAFLHDLTACAPLIQDFLAASSQAPADRSRKTAHV